MSYVFGLKSGPHRLITRDGRTFPLPLETFPGAMAQQSLDVVVQGPFAFGGTIEGAGQLALLTVAYGTKEASGNGLLRFATAAQALGWRRAFAAACRRAVRIENADTAERIDGRVAQCVTEEYQEPTLIAFSFRVESTSPVPHKLAPRVVNGTPAACPNASDLPCWPVITGTATGATATVSDGTRTLTVATTPGAAVRIDTTESDGRVYVAGDFGDASGGWPIVEPGGVTITCTGLSDVVTTYLEHVDADWTIEDEPTDPGGLVETLDADGFVLLSGPGLVETLDGDGFVVLSGVTETLDGDGFATFS